MLWSPVNVVNVGGVAFSDEQHENGHEPTASWLSERGRLTCAAGWAPMAVAETAPSRGARPRASRQGPSPLGLCVVAERSQLRPFVHTEHPHHSERRETFER